MGLNQETGELMAVKQIVLENTSSAGMQAEIAEVENEIHLLQRLSHPHVVRYIGTERAKARLGVVLGRWLLGCCRLVLLCCWFWGGGGGTHLAEIHHFPFVVPATTSPLPFLHLFDGIATSAS